METLNDKKKDYLLIHTEPDSHTDEKREQPSPEARHGAFLILLLLLTLTVALTALGVSIAALRISSSVDNEGTGFTEQDEQLDTFALHKVKAMLEAPGEMDPAAEHVELERADQLSNHRQKRNVDEANTDLCTSSSETGVKPLAHIVGPQTKFRLDVPDELSPFVVLSKQWLCSNESDSQALLQGGMIFHGSTGFLELPKSGVYYVYQKVTFGSTDSQDRLARARLVACVTGDDCEFFSDPYMQMDANLNGRYFTGKSQGGLFRFPAGTQIAIMVYNERFSHPDVSAITYDNSGHQTYMGAFLVDED